MPFRCSAAWLNKPIGSHQRSQGNAHRVASRSPIFCTVLYRVPMYLRFVATVLATTLRASGWSMGAGQQLKGPVALRSRADKPLSFPT